MKVSRHSLVLPHRGASPPGTEPSPARDTQWLCTVWVQGWGWLMLVPGFGRSCPGSLGKFCLMHFIPSCPNLPFLPLRKCHSANWWVWVLLLSGAQAGDRSQNSCLGEMSPPRTLKTSPGKRVRICSPDPGRVPVRSGAGARWQRLSPRHCVWLQLEDQSVQLEQLRQELDTRRDELDQAQRSLSHAKQVQGGGRSVHPNPHHMSLSCKTASLPPLWCKQCGEPLWGLTRVCPISVVSWACPQLPPHDCWACDMVTGEWQGSPVPTGRPARSSAPRWRLYRSRRRC